MQPLYTKTVYNRASSRQLLPLKCSHCGTTFLLQKRRLADALRNRKRSSGDFCSCACANRHRHALAPTVRCEQCGTRYRKLRSQLRRTAHNFCTRRCHVLWQNAHKTQGTRVSKLERWIQTQLVARYPAIKFEFNQTAAINGELDVFIPAMKLAVELNGIFHYEPIYGARKLVQIQTNDARKYQACIERGIELCIIDVAAMTYFKPTKGQRFLDIITDIVDAKLRRQ